MERNGVVVRMAKRTAQVTAVLLLAVSFAAFARPSNKWRIEMDGRARLDGEIELSIGQSGATPTRLVLGIPKGTSENAAARLLRDRIGESFGSDVYHVEVDDGEDVLVRARGSTHRFEIVVVRNTAEGLRIGLDRE